jgi:uncharacterized protein
MSEINPIQPGEAQLPTVEDAFTWKWRHTFLSIFVAALTIFLIFYFSGYQDSIDQWVGSLGTDFLFIIAVGFIAQMIDGALGMAYGVSCSTMLLSFGITPAAASASIHAAEVFTSGASGLMHLKFKNVNLKLFKTLLLPGVIGAVMGAYVLSSLVEDYTNWLKPCIALYTLYLGFLIIRKGIVDFRNASKIKNIPLLAAFGGCMDSIGGGGWGPIVSSTLIARGRDARYTIGSVNLTEFFVALASSITFFAMIGLQHWHIIIGLILGGVVAAPIAAYLSSRLPVKKLMIVVGVLIVIVSIRIIAMSIL